jgi:murein DD-endopeptidase MepM/ murein hydrolase activator NlpD
MPSLIHPVDPKYISQWYGAEFAGYINNVWYDRVYEQLFGLKGGHPGIDYAVGEGTPVKASAAGTIEFAGWGANWHSTVGGGSYTVVIDHGSYYTAYLHLTANSNRFVKGQKVKQGQVIALSGATGQGTGAHLHWQYMPKPVNFWDGRWGTRDQKQYITTVNVASTQEDALSAAEVKEIKAHITKEANRVLAGTGKAVWTYRLKSYTGKLYSAGAFVINNNTNGWKIPGLERLVKTIAARTGVSKADLDAAVKQIDTNTEEALEAGLENAVIDVNVTVQGQEVAK